MSAVLDHLASRRSVGPALLAEPGPDGAQLQKLLTIASRVPDHGAVVPWRFIVLEGESRAHFGVTCAPLYEGWLRRNQPALFEGDAARGTAAVNNIRVAFTRAPLVVIVVDRARDIPGKPPRWEQTLSVGAACMNLLTAASAMGFGASWVTGWVAISKPAHQVLGLADHERVGGVIHIGTPKQRPPDRPRPSLADIVTFWRLGEE